jgi:hypothetical protein
LGKRRRAVGHPLSKGRDLFLIEGLVRLTDESGHVETYKGGDTFLIPNGFKGVWENVEPVRKIYAIHEPEVK